MEAKEKELPEEVKLDRVQKAPIGTIVAFRSDNGTVKSAKIVRRSTEDKMLKLTTKYGVSHLMSYSDVVWVKTGTRWPRWVYNLLKNVDEEEQCQ